MPMNEYGEIIRNSSPPPPIPPVNDDRNNNNNGGGRSGIAIVIGIAILVAVIWFISSASGNKNSNTYSNNSSGNNSGYSQNDNGYSNENNDNYKDQREANEKIYTSEKLPCWLTDLECLINDGVSIENDSTGMTNTGEEYSHYLYGDEGDEITYYLNGEYASISGLWTICEQNKDTTDKNSFEIYADNSLVYSSPALTGGDLPESFEVPINNCEKLKIKFTSGIGAGELGNIRIYPDTSSAPINSSISEVTETGGMWLTDLDYLTNDGVSIENDSTGMTNTGEEYSHYLYGDEGSEIIYYLEGNYKTISGLWTICQQNKDTTDENSFEIYADDTLVYSSPALTGGDLPVAFNEEIKNCQKLKIVFTQGRGAGELGNISLR